MLYKIVHLIIDFAGTLLAGACLLRAWMQRQRVAMRNPLGQFVMTLTDWLIKPLRRLIPGYAGIDWASLVAALLVSLGAVLVLVALRAGSFDVGFPAVGSILGMALTWLVKWAIYLAQALVLIGAVLSWVNPFSPLLPVVDALSGPLLRPIRRVLPMMGRIDLSPLVFLLGTQIALIVLQDVGLS